MRTEPPGERLRRRLGAPPETDTADEQLDGPEGDPNSLLPRWLPDRSADTGWLGWRGWLDRVRADPGRTGAAALAVVAAIAVLITVFTIIRDRPAPVVSAKLPPVEMVSSASPRASSSPDAAAGPDEPVVVSVVGLVHSPGLATLAPGARIADALTAAGGAVDGADTAGLNMARPVADGEQIVVGIAPPSGQPTVLGSSVGTGAAEPAPAAPAAAPTSAPAEPAPRSPVNINTATAQQLDALPGVGPVTAAAIVAFRDAHGKFTSIDQLGEVNGIGPARLEKLRPLVRI